MKPRKRCNKLSCRSLVDYDIAYCEKHKQVKNNDRSEYKVRKEREGKYFEFYQTKSWRKLSTQYRYLNPSCEMCLKENKIVKVDVVDHIAEVRDCWDRRLDETNLMSLCHYHHNRKTTQARQARKATQK